MLKVVSIVALFAPAAHADRGDRWEGVMIAGQAGGAAFGGVLLGAAGAFGGTAIAGNNPFSGKSPSAGLLGAVIGGVVGTTAGVTIGVKVAGDIRGGNGAWFPTAASAVGGAVLTGLTLPLYADKVPDPVALGIATVTMLAPPILGYHLSTDERASAEKRVVVPLLVASF